MAKSADHKKKAAKALKKLKDGGAWWAAAQIEVEHTQVREAEGLPKDLMAGKVTDFHEVAIQLKQADLSFRFAMEIRNKLIDAYREVMRMHV